MIDKVESNPRQHITKPGLIKILKKKPAFLKSVFRTAIPSKKLRHKIMEKANNAAYSNEKEISPILDEENDAIIREFIKNQLPLLKEQTGKDCSYWLND